MVIVVPNNNVHPTVVLATITIRKKRKGNGNGLINQLRIDFFKNLFAITNANTPVSIIVTNANTYTRGKLSVHKYECNCSILFTV